MKKEIKNVVVSYSKKNELEYFSKDFKRHLQKAVSTIEKTGVKDILTIENDVIDVNVKNLEKLTIAKNKMQGQEKILLSHFITSLNNVLGINNINIIEKLENYKI